MTQTIARDKLFAQVLDPASRANPYPLYAQLRETPISLQSNGTYVVSTYQEIFQLLRDPRMSSDERQSTHGEGALAASGKLVPAGEEAHPPLLLLDPPTHDQLRRVVMRHFTPQLIGGVHDFVAANVAKLLDAKRGDQRIDIVKDLAYPLPVAVICELLGVPREDEPLFHTCSSSLARSLDPIQGMSEAEVQEISRAVIEVREYMQGLIASRQGKPSDDLLSGLYGEVIAGQMSRPDLIVTMILLLVAGHETTVNLITNGMLTLLRHPDALERLRRNPELIITTVEEVLRYDPPVQFRTRTTLTNVEITGAVIPKGATVVLLLASGDRDSKRFSHPDRFEPERANNEHFGFGGGSHYCVGAPLARVEAQIALNALVKRLINPRLVVDPPPYRDNASLRGPAQLLVDFNRLTDA